MKNISFLSENFQFLEAKLSIYLNRRVSVMGHVRPCILISLRCLREKKKTTHTQKKKKTRKKNFSIQTAPS